jgi:hypothetical protein
MLFHNLITFAHNNPCDNKIEYCKQSKQKKRCKYHIPKSLPLYMLGVRFISRSIYIFRICMSIMRHNIPMIFDCLVKHLESFLLIENREHFNFVDLWTFPAKKLDYKIKNSTTSWTLSRFPFFKQHIGAMYTDRKFLVLCFLVLIDTAIFTYGKKCEPCYRSNW